MFPVIAWWMNRLNSGLRNAFYVVAALGSVVIFQYLTGHITDNPTFRSELIRALLTFASGVCLYQLARSWAPSVPQIMGWICLAMIVVCSIIPFFGLLMPFAFAGLVLLCSDMTAPTTQFLAKPICLYFGKLSFGIYLIHYEVFHILQWLFITDRLPQAFSWFAFVASCVFIWFMAVIVHHWVEVPCQAFGRQCAAIAPKSDTSISSAKF